MSLSCSGRDSESPFARIEFASFDCSANSLACSAALSSPVASSPRAIAAVFSSSARNFSACLIVFSISGISTPILSMSAIAFSLQFRIASFVVVALSLAKTCVDLIDCCCQYARLVFQVPKLPFVSPAPRSGCLVCTGERCIPMRTRFQTGNAGKSCHCTQAIFCEIRRRLRFCRFCARAIPVFLRELCHLQTNSLCIRIDLGRSKSNARLLAPARLAHRFF